MFASHSSSSSSSERLQLNVVEAAAHARSGKFRRTRRRPDESEDAIRKALEAPTDVDIMKDHVSSGFVAKRGDGSRYIGKLVAAAQVRKDDAERLAERRLQLQRQEQGELFPDKAHFVTKSYRAALQRRTESLRESANRSNPNDDVKTSSTPHASLLRFTSMERRLSSTDADNLVHRVDEDTNAKEEVEYRDGDSGLGPVEKPGVIEEGPEKPNSGAHTESHARTARDRRKSRFSSSETPTSNNTTKTPPKKRGMRRNDEQAIEAYRQRYLERRDRRLGNFNK